MKLMIVKLARPDDSPIGPTPGVTIGPCDNHGYPHTHTTDHSKDLLGFMRDLVPEGAGIPVTDDVFVEARTVLDADDRRPWLGWFPVFVEGPDGACSSVSLPVVGFEDFDLGGGSAHE